MQTLRLGSRGEDVEKWQYFLRGRELLMTEVNGEFGASTHQATQEFQSRHGLLDDGIVGNRTFAEAMRIGFSAVQDDPSLPDTLDGPPKPPFNALGPTGRNQVFGSFTYETAPAPGNPEAIRVTSSWAQENLLRINIPQLAGIKGVPSSGELLLHKLAAPRVAQLFERWEQAGLSKLVLTFGGAYTPRFVRGKLGVLSAHAHGTAFDINVAWNGFGIHPANVGAKGSVRELVPLANELGFYWGGHFTKRDGMHFELVKV